MRPTYERNSKTKLVATVVTIIVIAGIVLFADHLKAASKTSASNLATTSASSTTPTNNTTTTTPATDTTDSTGTATSTNTSTYKDGTYSASSNYYVPHGNESIKVTLTLQNGVITSSSISNSEGDPDSASFQEDFASAYKSYVIGKKISSVNLDVVAGASDTTQGFDDAVSQILSQATS